MGELFSAVDVSNNRLIDLLELDLFIKGMFNKPNELVKSVSSKDMMLFFAFLDLDKCKEVTKEEFIR